MDDIDGPAAGARPVPDGATGRPRDRSRRELSPRWNPHVVVLVVGGLALIAMGVRLYRSALDVVYSDFTSRGTHGLSDVEDGDVARDLVAMQVEWTVGPLLIAFGIISVLVGVTVLAVRFRRGASP
jgi:Ca2+/Na+ antiporter